ncbi:MAG: type II secretion system protein GspJ [Verrucomicrobiota bacterium]
MRTQPRVSARRAFTLIEIMMALALFGLLVAAIYASWTLIIRSAQIGLSASARIQRERIALRTIEESLGCVRSFEADRQHYGFVAENGDGGFLSFVARLPESFPRDGRFPDFDVRRVTFSIEGGSDSQSQLVLRQNPILMEMDQTERDKPLVLAKGVNKMEFEFWDDRKKDWVDEWKATNQLPKMLKLTLSFVRPSPGGNSQREEVSRIIQLPSIMVPIAVQRPGQQPGQPPGIQPGQPGQPGQPVPSQPGRPGGQSGLIRF